MDVFCGTVGRANESVVKLNVLGCCCTREWLWFPRVAVPPVSKAVLFNVAGVPAANGVEKLKGASSLFTVPCNGEVERLKAGPLADREGPKSMIPPVNKKPFVSGIALALACQNTRSNVIRICMGLPVRMAEVA
jgi:hypothetical protein